MDMGEGVIWHEDDTEWEMQLQRQRLNRLMDVARITVGRNFSASEWRRYFAGEKYRKTFPDLPGAD
jgi:hypothetical protein